MKNSRGAPASLTRCAGTAATAQGQRRPLLTVAPETAHSPAAAQLPPGYFDALQQALCHAMGALR
jgi:hypothetical protein